MASDRPIRAGDIVHRAAELDLSRANEENLLVPASLSSEAPVERLWGDEVLEHRPEAVDLSRAVGGRLPLLVAHDAREIPRAGNVVDVHLAGGRLRGSLQFANTERGQELFQAIRDGFAGEVSVGYQVIEVSDAEEDPETGRRVYRVTRWAPFEASLVNLPADASVGANRSREGRTTMSDSETRALQQRAAQGERDRIQEIEDIGKHFDLDDELVRRAINDGTSIEAFRKVALDNLSTPAAARAVAENSSRSVGLYGRDLERYSLRRAILAMATGSWRDAGLEREVSNAAARAFGRQSEGDRILVPIEAFGDQKRTVLKGGDGASLVGVDHRDDLYVDTLRAASVVGRAGASFLDGLHGDVAIPRQASAEVVQWIDEDESLVADDAVFDSISLSPRTVGALTTLSRKLLLQSSPAAEIVTRMSIALGLAKELDRVALAGSGVDPEPTGILNTSLIGDVSHGTNGGAPTWATMVQLETEVAIDDVPFTRTGYVTSPKAAGKLKTVPKETGEASYLWEPDPRRSDGWQMNGHRGFTTTNVPDDLTKAAGEDLSAVIFGNWSDLVVARWGVVEVLVNPYGIVQFPKGGLEVRGLLDCDVAVRHASSFAAAQDLDAN